MSEAQYKMYEKRKGSKPLEFKCDTLELKRWLEKRVQSLKEVRYEFEDLWKQLRLYFEPNIGKALLDASDRNQVVASREDEKIINSAPRQSAHRYAAGMQSGITNQAQQWFQIVARTMEDEVAERPDLKKWLDSTTKAIARAFQRGNVYQTTDQVYLHAGVMGTSVCLLLRGDHEGEVFLHLLDEGDYWIAENRFQMVDTLLRRMDMSLGQCANEFMIANLPETWRDKIEKDGRLEERVQVYNLIFPNDPDNELFCDIDKDTPFVSIYFLEGNDNNAGQNGILDIRPFSYNPIIAYRQFYCGSVYGKGIGEMSLADNKELQELEDYQLRMIAQEAMPSLLAPASMKGKPINMFPGGVTYIDGMNPASGSQVERLFTTQPGIDKVSMKIQEVEQKIAKAWYGDLFAMMLNINSRPKTMTAREVNELSGEKITLLGPVLTRMDREFLNPLVDGVFTILFEDGLLPEVPDAIASGEVTMNTEYISSIHAEMVANLKMRGILKSLDIIGILAQGLPEVLDKVNGDQIVDEVGIIYPSTASFIRSDKEANAIRQNRADTQQKMMREQQMVEMMKGAGSQAKALSETTVGNGNALDALMRGEIA